MGYGTNGLTFNTLRSANLERVPLFKNAKGEIAHQEGLKSWSVDQWFKAVVGELGEFANISKKVDRGDFTQEEAKQAMADELADVQIYLDLLAARCGIDLGKATMKKWNEVSVRVGVSLYIDAEDWHYTKDKRS